MKKPLYFVALWLSKEPKAKMVGVAQSVEPQVVALVVAGSSPVAHPQTPKTSRSSSG